MALAIAASEQEEQKAKQNQDVSEEEMIKRAIAESEAHEANSKREEEQKLLEAIRQSEEMLIIEQERLQKLQEEEEKQINAEIEQSKQAEVEEKRVKMEKRARQMEAKRKELQEQQEALEKSMAQGYGDERQKLINEAKEAKRLEMLGRLRDQAKKEDQVSVQIVSSTLIDSYNFELLYDQRLADLKKARQAEAAATVDKSDDVRQSHSEGMMMSLDKKVLSQMQ